MMGKKKVVVNCPHTEKRYYAKGMCVNCYHRQGRTKKAWKCAHTHKMHYSKGLCKFCYLASYYKNRTSDQLADEGPAQHTMRGAAANDGNDGDEGGDEVVI